MAISRSVRKIRTAISPRFATSTFRNGSGRRPARSESAGITREPLPSLFPGGAALLEERAESFLALGRGAQARDRANGVLDGVVAAEREAFPDQPLGGGHRAGAVALDRV